MIFHTDHGTAVVVDDDAYDDDDDTRFENFHLLTVYDLIVVFYDFEGMK